MNHFASLPRHVLTMLALCVVGCSQPSTMSGDAGSNDAATLPDAPAIDAAVDEDAGETAPDAAEPDAAIGDDGGLCNACVEDTIAWGSAGGRVCSHPVSALSACRDYTRERLAMGCKLDDLTCGNEVACSGLDTVLVEDITAALQHADVVAALADAPVLYGTDPRPVDGTVDWFEVAGSERVEVGEGPTVPAGVAALVSLLHDLDAQQLALPDCATVFPGT